MDCEPHSLTGLFMHSFVTIHSLETVAAPVSGHKIASDPALAPPRVWLQAAPVETPRVAVTPTSTRVRIPGAHVSVANTSSI